MVRGKLEHKTILDFSEGKVTKNRIRQSLRKVEVLENIQTKHNLVLRENWIVVGIFRINIVPDSISTESRNKLRQYGKLAINIQEKISHNRWTKINPHSDGRFKDQYWSSSTNRYAICIKDLIDIIYHCAKIHKLRAFS